MKLFTQYHHNNKLTYILAGHDGKIDLNLSPYDSDLMDNMIILSNLTSTLVRSNNLATEPYLAERWETTDEKIWDFYLRQGLFAEDGSPITAEGYVKVFKLLLFNYLKKKDIASFKDLKGIDNFKTDISSEIGIEVLNIYQIRFTFNKKPSGFLELLSKPIFAYYVPADFDEQGNWKDLKKVTPTGPYKIDSISKNQIRFIKRDNWFSFSEKTPNEVLLVYDSLKEAVKFKPERTVINLLSSDEIPIPQGFNLVRSTGRATAYFSLKHSGDSIFSSVYNRNLFSRKLEESIKLDNPQFYKYNLHSTFYPFQTYRVNDSTPVSNRFDLSDTTKREIFISFGPYPKNMLGPLSLYLIDTITKILKEDGISVRVDDTKMSFKDYFDKTRSNTYYDMYLGQVSCGDRIVSWVVNMMFCSSLGANLPDPNRKVCKLTEEFDNSDMTVEEYGEKFEKILKEEDVVIPIGQQIMHLFYSYDLCGAANQIHSTRFDTVNLP